VKRTTAQSKTGFFCGYGAAEATPFFLIFQAGWSDCVYFLNDSRRFSLSFISVAHLDFSSKYLYILGYSAVSELSPDVLSAYDTSHENVRYFTLQRFFCAYIPSSLDYIDATAC
jgi:hypothetical protein